MTEEMKTIENPESLVPSVEEELQKTLPTDEEPPFERQARRSLIVWVYSLKQLKNLRRFGYIQFVSKRLKYVVIYMNEDKIEEAEEKLNKLHFVRSVERSYRPDVEMNFAEKIGTKAAYSMLVEEDGFEVDEVNTRIKLADNI